MASQSQQLSKIQYGTEGSSYGTETASYSELHKVQSSEISSDNANIYERGLGEGLNIVKKYLGPFASGSSLVFDVEDFDILKHWVGPKTGAGSVGDPYILTEATKTAIGSQLEPFSLERSNDTEATKSVELLTGGIGTQFTLSGSLNSVLSCSSQLIGQKTTERTTGETFVKSTINSFVMLNGTWKWGATPSAIAGVQSFDLTMTNLMNIEQSRSIESRFILQPQLDGRDYKLRVTILMAQALAATIITNFYTGGLTPEDGSTTINPTADLEFKIELVSGNKLAYIWLDQCAIDRIVRTVNVGGGLVLLTFDVTADEGKGNVPITWWEI